MTESERPLLELGPETEGQPSVTRTTVPEWQFWPPGSKMQIAIVAAMFGFLNLVLIAIVVVIVVRHL